MELPTLVRPFLLSAMATPGTTVSKGALDVFAVRMSPDGRAVGRRRHLCRRGAGEAAFRMPEHPAVGLLAVPSPDAELAPLGAAAEEELSAWVDALAPTLCPGRAPRDVTWAEVPGRVELEEGQRLAAPSGVVWASGAGLRVRSADGPEIGARAFPLSRRLWVAAASPTSVEVVPFAGPEQTSRIRAFYAFVLAELAASIERSDTLEREHASRRAASARAALRRGTWHLASVLAPLDPEQERAEGEALLAAAQNVGRSLGVPIRPPVHSAGGQRDRLGQIARASRVRIRKVLLDGSWWRDDVGALVAILAPDEEGGPARPAAVVRRSGRNVLVLDGEPVRLTERLADRVHPVGYTFYRPFPDEPVSVAELVSFGLHGARRDVTTVMGVGAAVGLLGLLAPFATGELFSTAIPEADRSLLVQLVVALGAAALGTAAFGITRAFALLRLESRMDVSVQAAVWDRLLKLPTSFFRSFTAGDLASRAGAISSIRRLISGATLSSMLGAVFSLLYLAVMAMYSLALTGVALGLTALALGATLLAARYQLRSQREIAEIRTRLQGRVLQYLTGLPKLRVAGAEPKAFVRWAERFARQRTLEIHARRVGIGLSTFNAAFPILSSVALFGAVYLGDGSLALGSFVAFLAAYGSFSAAVLSLSGAFTSVLMAVPLYEQARPILQSLPESLGTRPDPGPLSGQVALERVLFRYDADGPPTLHDVSIRAEAGEFVALVGPSGSGKSTVLRLLLGFEDPEVGSVVYDDHALAEVDVQAVRRQLGVVLQDGGLMQGDILSNIIGSSTATPDDALRAARMAGLEADIAEMPMGLHTVISEGGGSLSGGQRQRLLIARAIVHRPRILLFDEATSALDNHTQALVSESLESLEATRIVIAHRLSTIRNADRIYVLDAGRVVQSGTYDELADAEGLFQTLVQRQVA